MSIYTGDKKAILYKGDYKPARLYKSNREIAGYSYETFTGQNLSIEKTYRDKPKKIVINSGFIPGKNLLDRETGFASNYLKAETPVSAYNGTAMFSNTDKSYLKASHTYTISYDVECLSVPEYTTVYGDQVGFALRTNDFSNTIKLCINRVLSAGDKFSVAVTFTLPDNFVPTDYSMFYYTNSLINNGRYLNPSVIFRNVQIEESETATEFEPFKKPQYQTLLWNNTKIPVNYALPQSGKIVYENDTLTLYTDTAEDITNSTLKRQLDALVTAPSLTTASITEGTLEVTVRVS